jgi:hypothetical protein
LQYGHRLTVLATFRKGLFIPLFPHGRYQPLWGYVASVDGTTGRALTRQVDYVTSCHTKLFKLGMRKQFTYQPIIQLFAFQHIYRIVRESKRINLNMPVLAIVGHAK